MHGMCGEWYVCTCVCVCVCMVCGVCMRVHLVNLGMWRCFSSCIAPVKPLAHVGKLGELSAVQALFGVAYVNNCVH